jgi:hypothetical protein
MPNAFPEQLSERVSIFRTRRLPSPARLAGYSALIEAYDLEVPLPRQLLAIGARHRVVEEGGWRLLTPRHAPENTLTGHLTFALKWEGLDLAVLKRLFHRIGVEPVIAIIRDQPTGTYARRIWFLYEWLLQTRLELPDASAAISYCDVLDPRLQCAAKVSAHHATASGIICPERRSFALWSFAASGSQFLERDLPRRPRHRRTGAGGRWPAPQLFLLLADSRPASRSKASSRQPHGSNDGAGQSAKPAGFR